MTADYRAGGHMYIHHGRFNCALHTCERVADVEIDLRLALGAIRRGEERVVRGVDVRRVNSLFECYQLGGATSPGYTLVEAVAALTDAESLRALTEARP